MKLNRWEKIGIIGSILWAATGGALSQSMMEVEMTGQPLTYNEGGIVTGCGVRVVGVLPPIPSQKTFQSFDISANLWKNGHSLIKMIGQEDPFPYAANKTRRKVLFSGWLKAEGKIPAAPTIGEFRESPDDRGAYLFPVDPDGTLYFLMASMKLEPVQVAIRWDAKTEWIYTGSIQLGERERAQISKCLKEIFS